MRLTPLVLLAWTTGGTALAECPPDHDARITWIQGRLAHGAHRATIWVRAWEIGIAAATALDLALIPILGDTRSNRIDFGLGAATTIIGIVPLVFWQPKVLDDHEELDALVAKGNADRCVLLADAERRLAADVDAQHQQRAWYMHAGNVVLNAGVTLLFGAFHHWTSGILNGIGGALVGELIIFTEPIDQIDDLDRYHRGTWQVVPTVEAHGAGLALAIRF